MKKAVLLQRLYALRAELLELQQRAVESAEWIGISPISKYYKGRTDAYQHAVTKLDMFLAEPRKKVHKK